MDPERRRRRTDKLVPPPRLEMSRDEVARRAYELFLMRGAEHGRDLEDWLQAERELTWEALRFEGRRAS
jgi:hypothetical protein